MKRISSIVLWVVASIATAGTGLAQTNGVQAKVPFAFAAGRTWLPRGQLHRLAGIAAGDQHSKRGHAARGGVEHDPA